MFGGQVQAQFTGGAHRRSLAGGTPRDSSDPGTPGRTGSASLSVRRGTGKRSVLTGALLSYAGFRGNAGTRRLRDAGADEPDADTRGSEPDSTCPSGLFSDRRQNLTCTATSHTGNESATRYTIAVECHGEIPSSSPDRSLHHQLPTRHGRSRRQASRSRQRIRRLRRLPLRKGGKLPDPGRLSGRCEPRLATVREGYWCRRWESNPHTLPGTRF